MNNNWCVTGFLTAIFCASFNLHAQPIGTKPESFETLKAKAEAGDVIAQENLGRYYSSIGADQDAAESAKWWRKAAEQDEPKAQVHLGVCYDSGDGVPKDVAEALKWFRKAALQNVPQAQYNLGIYYQTGQGVAKDEVEAANRYRKSGEQGYAEAQYNLGYCYEH